MNCLKLPFVKVVGQETRRQQKLSIFQSVQQAQGESGCAIPQHNLTAKTETTAFLFMDTEEFFKT
jgi:hypothetical protein